MDFCTSNATVPPCGTGAHGCASSGTSWPGTAEGGCATQSRCVMELLDYLECLKEWLSGIRCGRAGAERCPPLQIGTLFVTVSCTYRGEGGNWLEKPNSERRSQREWLPSENAPLCSSLLRLDTKLRCRKARQSGAAIRPPGARSPTPDAGEAERKAQRERTSEVLLTSA